MSPATVLWSASLRCANVRRRGNRIFGARSEAPIRTIISATQLNLVVSGYVTSVDVKDFPCDERRRLQIHHAVNDIRKPSIRPIGWSMARLGLPGANALSLCGQSHRVYPPCPACQSPDAARQLQVFLQSSRYRIDDILNADGKTANSFPGRVANRVRDGSLDTAVPSMPIPLTPPGKCRSSSSIIAISNSGMSAWTGLGSRRSRRRRCGLTRDPSPFSHAAPCRCRRSSRRHTGSSPATD